MPIKLMDAQPSGPKNWLAISHGFAAISPADQIEAYIVEQGGRRTIAEVPASAYVNAREVATFITKAVNAYERNCDIIAGVETVLEAFLERKKSRFFNRT